MEDVVHELIVLDCELSLTKWKYNNNSLIITFLGVYYLTTHIYIFFLELGAVREDLRVSDSFIHRISFLFRNGARLIICERPEEAGNDAESTAREKIITNPSSVCRPEVR